MIPLLKKYNQTLFRIYFKTASKNYCTLHHLKESAVSNRIRRGALPAVAYLELPYLNNLKLIQKTYVWA
ncbi:MAG: hypothetical protein U5N85_11900 [Arcicella sp.]|nr:hypothetical protein [Arcicella sp.]